jgi:hypothetical protein
MREFLLVNRGSWQRMKNVVLYGIIRIIRIIPYFWAEYVLIRSLCKMLVIIINILHTHLSYFNFPIITLFFAYQIFHRIALIK